MKIKITITLLILTCLLGSSKTINAQNFKIDPGHSSVQIQVERFGVVNVVGRFKDVNGSIQFSKNNISNTTAEALIKVDSYDANNPAGETAVKSKAFLDATMYPEISFIGKSTTSKDGQNYLVGDLTIHGTTRQIELPFKVKGPLLDLPTRKQSIAFNATITINRQDYGVNFDKKLPDGTLIVGNNIEIIITVLAIAE